MTQHPRLLLPGATYFFTVRLERQGSTLLTDHIETLRWAYAKAVRDYPVTCHAMVVLPDHLHAVWTEPDSGVWYSERWRRIKACFSQAIPQISQVIPQISQAIPKMEPMRAAPDARREPGIWQRRFYEHAILTTEDLRRAVAHCDDNPVKHGLVSDAALWPFSSFAKSRVERVAKHATPFIPSVPRQDQRQDQHVPA